MKSLGRYWYQLGKTLRVHQVFVIVVAVLLVLLAVFIRINELGSMPLDQTYLQQEIDKIKPVKFNQEAIEQIKALNESNVSDPGTRLPANRQNPFNE
jgi:hypothetical protein